ncbi:hypothetical protein [Erwinia rhapontici]
MPPMKTKIRTHLRRHKLFYDGARPAAVLILLLIAALIAELYVQ